MTSDSGLTVRECGQLEKAFKALSKEEQIEIFSMLIVPVKVLMKANGYHMISVIGKLRRKSKDEMEVEHCPGIYAEFSVSQITSLRFRPAGFEHVMFVDLGK